LSTRFYLFPDGGEPVRMSNRLVNGLVLGNDTLQQFAETRQRVLTAFLEVEDGKPQRLLQAEGSILVFDDEGGIQEGLHEALALAMELIHATERNGTVVSLRPHATKKKLDSEFRWDPGKREIERIIADIWPKKKDDRLKAFNSTTKRKPPLTFDARRALETVTQGFWKIPYEIEKLKEPSLKSFLAEARQRANHDPDFGRLYRAIADMAEWQLGVEKRRRSGKGEWYAVVEVMVWRDGAGEALARYYQRCSSRDDAVAAVRRLLVEHADEFSDTTTLETELLTDLEWERRAYPE
jgi:hypothetical protein